MHLNFTFKRLAYLWATVSFFFLFPANLRSQTIIWEETFDAYANGVITGTGDPDDMVVWESDGVNHEGMGFNEKYKGVCVYDGSLRGQYTTQEPYINWQILESDPIEIGSYVNVSVTLDFWKEDDNKNFDNNDYIEIQYSVDGDDWSDFTTNGKQTGEFNGTLEASVEGLTGSTLRLKIIMYNDDNAKYYYADNIEVSGTLLSSEGAQGYTVDSDDNTFTVPNGVSEITVNCWGAGGGGATCTTTQNGPNRTTYNGGGGGGGAYASSTFSVTPGDTYTIEVGEGGAASGDGDASYIYLSSGTNIVYAVGGSGATQNDEDGAAGGAAADCTGDTRYSGGDGGDATEEGNGPNRTYYSGAGGGGAGSEANGGDASDETAGTGAEANGGAGADGIEGPDDGADGSLYGGGGSGACSSGNNGPGGGGTYTGGSGADGYVEISYTQTGSTYYTYQSGDWDVAATWTTDPSGTLSLNAAVPGNSDKVVVLNGRTVSTTADDYDVAALKINEGGIVDIAATEGHDFGTVSGEGKLKLSTTNFPSGTFDAFVSADGGTVEYYDVTGTLNQATYNNLLFTNASLSAAQSTSNPYASDLLHAYTFEDGTASDSKGDADGTLHGGTVSDGAYVASADGNYIELPTSVVDDLNDTDHLSIEAYVTSGTNTGYTMLAYFGGNNGYGSYWLSIARGDDVTKTAVNNNGSNEDGATGDEPAAGEVHHYVSVLDGSTLYLYIDGELVDQEEVNKPTLDDTYAYLCKGGYAADPTWIGSIHEFNIYDKALSSDEVATRYNTNYQVYGDLTLNSASFQFGADDASVIDMAVDGSITVSSGSNISVSTSNVIHSLTIGGDFTNAGTVQFTNRSGEVDIDYLTTDPDDGGVIVTFTGLSDNTLSCKGTTDFHRLIVNKGEDQTYVLTVNSSDEDYFRLYGRNDQDPTDFDYNDENLDTVLKNLWIRNGTLKLEGKIHIPSLTEGGKDNAYIPLNGCLWLNGDDVRVDVTLEGEGGSSGDQAMVPFGKLRVDAGILDCKDAAGIVYRGTAEFEINGGQVLATQFRPSSYSGDALTSFTMTGGEMTLYGQDYGTDYEINVDKPIFCLPFSTNTFIMSGGTLNVGYANANGALVIGADNVEVTGGEVNISVNNNYYYNGSYQAAYYYINSTAPFYDLNIQKDDGGLDVIVHTITSSGLSATPSYTTLEAQALQVLHNLTIEGDNGAVLDMNSQDLYVGGDFTIESGATFKPTENTVYFNGESTQTFDASGTINNDLNKVFLTESADLTLDGNDININDTLSIGSGCTIRDNGYNIYALGNVVNKGTHFQQTTGAGSIRLSGSAAQIISGDGEGSFNNLIIDNANGVSTTADFRITGNLALVDGLVNIGNNNILLDTTANIYSNTAFDEQDFNASKMLLTNGLASDGGLSKNFASTEAFWFPFGFTADEETYYMPASIQFTSAPETYGTVTTRPVSTRHPLAQDSENATLCYWKTTSVNFEGIASASVNHLYYYDYDQSNDFVEGSEEDYIAGYYDRTKYAWYKIDNTGLVNEATNELKYPSDSQCDGDYMAGEPGAFADIPTLYSITDGDWDDAATWSTEGFDGTAGTVIPSIDYIVLIGDSAHYHTVTIPEGTNDQSCGSLSIAEGSTLDLQNTSGHNFASIERGKVIGNGTLRIGSSNYFPTGDFGDFIGEDGGTVEYYTYASDIVIPVSSSSLSLGTYYRLKLSTSGAYTVELPARDLTIYDSLVVRGSSTARFNSSAAYTLNVENSLVVEGGALSLNDYAHTISIDSNLVVAAGASFEAVSGNGHSLELQGNLQVEGSFDMNKGGTAHTYFTGSVNDTISGAGSIEFYTLTVDKGSDDSAVLAVVAEDVRSGFTNPFLTLSNGTFRLENAALDLTITTTSAFEIPASACFSVKEGTATIGTIADDGDVILHGKLELLGGTLNVGTNNDSYNNDIEIPAAGDPTLWVEAGTLNVYGQVRRNLEVTTGALSYYQSGGVVNLYGQNNESSRAKLEILNTGSSFSMSGGDIYILDDAGETYKDLYLQPDSYAVTGGAFHIGNDALTGLSVDLVMSCPIWDMEVCASNTVVVNTLDQVIYNDLTIQEGAIYNANALDVNIGGSLYNYNTSTTVGIDVGGFRPGAFTQTTSFDGSAAQSIVGTGSNMVNFGNLVINCSDTLALDAIDVSVNKDATLSSGVWNDGSQSIYLYEDFENQEIHYSPTTTGGLHFVGDAVQYISGSGTGIVGNMILNNTEGVTLKDNMTITHVLTFTEGSLYIDDYLLTFDTEATITGSLDEDHMIIENGVMSDLGVKKVFDSGDTEAFTYPMGVSGKYTPITYDFSANANDGASITVKLVNYLHKSITETDDLDDYVSYYWDVVESGFDATYTLSHQYVYHDEDIVGDEANYLPQQYIEADDEWYDLSGDGSVDAASNTISLTSVSYIDGEYTAGQEYTSQPILYSSGDHDWTSLSWELEDGSTFTDYPKGNPVVIQEGHTITMDVDSADAYSVSIYGILDIEQTVFHDFGHVYGPGKIVVAASDEGSFVIPGGEYTDFLSNALSTIEFTGDNDGTLPLKPGNDYKPFQNVIFSGSGIKYMSAENMKVQGDLLIEDGTQLSNANYNKNLTILGDWTDGNTAQNGFVPGTGKVTFSGTDTQIVALNYTEQFYNLAIDNAAGVDMSASTAGLEVSKYLYLTDGVFTTSATGLITLTNTSGTAVSGGSSDSYVDGPLAKVFTAGQSFSYPTGNAERYGVIKLSSVSLAGTYTASYYNESPVSASLTSPLSGISDNEYWVVERPDGASANVSLRYDADSYSGFTGTTALRNRLRVVEYSSDDAAWSIRGASVSGNASAGTVATSTAVSANDFIFTLGHIGVTATIETDDSPYTICDNDEKATVPVTLTGTSPWKLVYQTSDGTTTKTFTQSDITSASYEISLAGSDMGGYSGTAYTVSLVSVSDATETVVVSSNTVDINLKQTYTPNITGTFTVGVGEDRTFSTTSHSGSTYAWSWSETDGGSPSTGTAYSYATTITSTTGSYTLVVTETLNGCAVSDEQVITVVNSPSPAISPVSSNVCQGDEITYKTTAISGHTYNWTISGGTVTGGSTSSETVTVEWTGTGNASIFLTEGNSGVEGEDSVKLVISTMPDHSGISTAITDACYGSAGAIDLSSSFTGISYQLHLSSDSSTINTAVSGTDGQTLTLTTQELTSATDFFVEAANEGCALRIPDSDDLTVDVNALPTITLADLSGVYRGVNTALEYTTTGDPDTVEISFTTAAKSLGFLDILTSISSSGSINLSIPVNALQNLAATITVSNSTTGCSSEATSLSAIIGDENVWVGATNSKWYTKSNWGFGKVPDDTTNIIILASADSMPDIDSLGATFNDILIQSGATVACEDDKEIAVLGNWVNNGSFEASKGKVVFEGTTTISGSGNQTFHDVEIATGASLTAKAGSSFYLSGDLKQLGSFDYNGNTLVFNGTGTQTLSASDTLRFNQFTMNKEDTSALVLATPVLVQTNLSLSAGVLSTSSGATLTVADGATISGGSAAAYIDGPVVKIGDEPFTFPVGSAGRYSALSISGLQNFTTSSSFTCTYFYTAPEHQEDVANMDHVSEMEYWDLTRNTDNSEACYVQLYYDHADSSGIESTDLLVAHYDGSYWQNMGGTVSGSLDNGSGTVTSTVLFEDFSPITYGTMSASEVNPLPISLASFTGYAKAEQIVLDWITYSETNNDYFELQHSTDASNFSTIATVAGAGNSDESLSYSYTDTDPEVGINYYRLKQVDYDGTSTYHDVIAVNYSPATSLSSAFYFDLYPNPFNEGTLLMDLAGVEDNSTIEILIYAVNGNQVAYTKTILPEEKSLNLIPDVAEHLAQGVYMVRLKTNTTVSSRKLVVQ